MGRKFKGAELKTSYFKCAVDNLKQVSGKPKRLWPSEPPIYDKSEIIKKSEQKKPETSTNQNQLNLF